MQSWQICIDRLIEAHPPFFFFLFTYTVCKHIIMLYIELHLQVLGPTRDWHCSNCCCCPCAHLGPRSGAVNKGTAAGLWSLAPYGVGKVVLLVGGRGRLTRGMQAHFPSGDRTAFISRKAGVSLLPVYLKATEIARRLQGGTVHSYTGRTTAIDFPDRLKRRVKLFVCLCAKLPC